HFLGHRAPRRLIIMTATSVVSLGATRNHLILRVTVLTDSVNIVRSIKRLNRFCGAHTAQNDRNCRKGCWKETKQIHTYLPTLQVIKAAISQQFQNSKSCPVVCDTNKTH